MLSAETCSTGALNVVPEMTLQDRLVLMKNLGYPAALHTALATQDRACGVIQLMALLVEQSKDPALIIQAHLLIDSWNTECSAVFDPILRASY